MKFLEKNIMRMRKKEETQISRKPATKKPTGPIGGYHHGHA